MSARLQPTGRAGVHVGAMSTDAAGAKPAIAPEKPAPDLAGVSAFVAKVLDQLSLSSWLPGTLFAVSVTVLAKFRGRGDVDLAAVISEVSKDKNWVTVLVWAVPVLLLSVLVIQASSFAAIQFLEGYGAARGPGRWCRTGLIRWQAGQLNRLEERIGLVRMRAFDDSAGRWKGEAPEVVMALRASAYGLGEPDLRDEHKTRLAKLRWETECDPWQMARLVEMEERFKEFPAPHRLLPTRLGNLLRATEDGLTHTLGDVSQFALRRRALIPSRVQVQHDQFRARLDMYATLTLVSAILVVLSVVLLVSGGVAWRHVVLVSAVFGVFVVVSYRAAVASARLLHHPARHGLSRALTRPAAR